MLSEHISGDLDRLRPLLKQLAACLLHLHQRGFVHGDFKLKNAIRELATNQWCVAASSFVTRGAPGLSSSHPAKLCHACSVS